MICSWKNHCAHNSFFKTCNLALLFFPLFSPFDILFVFRNAIEIWSFHAIVSFCLNFVFFYVNYCLVLIFVDSLISFFSFFCYFFLYLFLSLSHSLSPSPISKSRSIHEIRDRRKGTASLSFKIIQDKNKKHINHSPFHCCMFLIFLIFSSSDFAFLFSFFLSSSFFFFFFFFSFFLLFFLSFL